MSRPRRIPGPNSDPSKIVDLVCETCGTTVTKYRSQVNGRHHFYCSQVCKADGQKRLSHSQEDIDRFWSKVQKSGPDDCWEWQGSRLKKGYGRIAWPGFSSPSNAHRISFFLANGYFPEVVRHECDNPPCCNPAHLLPGTQLDNIQDMVDRGRKRKAAAH